MPDGKIMAKVTSALTYSAGTGRSTRVVNATIAHRGAHLLIWWEEVRHIGQDQLINLKTERTR